MPMTAQLWTLNALATELSMDRRSLARKIEALEPDQQKGKSKQWLMRRVVDAVFKSDDDLDLTEERARLAKEQADRTEMENALRRAELLERGVVDQAVIGAFARVRSRLLAIPSKLAPRMSRGMDAAEAEGMLRAAIHDALKELSETDVAKLANGDSDMVAGANAAA